MNFNWRKGGGSARMIGISKREKFYQQEYCGCAYSLCDTNLHRKATDREPIRIGIRYYGEDDAVDAVAFMMGRATSIPCLAELRAFSRHWSWYEPMPAHVSFSRGERLCRVPHGSERKGYGGYLTM